MRLLIDCASAKPRAFTAILRDFWVAVKKPARARAQSAVCGSDRYYAMQGVQSTSSRPGNRDSRSRSPAGRGYTKSDLAITTIETIANIEKCGAFSLTFRLNKLTI